MSRASQPRDLGAPGAREVRVRGQPRTADPDEVEAPPASGSRSPRASRERDELVGDDLRGVRSRERAHRHAHPGEPLRIGEQLLGESRHAPRARSGPRRSLRRPPRSAARSASGGRQSRAGTGTRIAGVPPRRAPTRCRPRARSRGRPPRAPHRSRRSTRAGRSRRATRAAQRVVVALPRDVQHGRPPSPNASTANSFSACAPASPPKTASTGRSGGSPNALAPPPSRRRDARPGSGARRPGTSTRRARRSRTREDAARERGREPVREPEMRVRLGQRGRDAPEPRREHHRPGDVATAAEHDVRPPAREDPMHANGARIACQAARRSPRPIRRGKPETANVSSSKPASGTSCDSTRPRDPANVTVTPRARSASATASAGRT